jgi:hypothetical protein
MVSNWWMRAADGITIAGVNRKFTTPSASKTPAQIFRELSSRQSLAIYRELLGPASAEIAAGGI